MSELPFRLSIRDVQTWRLLAERFEENEERPDWAKVDDGAAGEIRMFAADDASRLDITYESRFFGDDYAIAVYLIARFDATGDEDVIANLGEKLQHLDGTQAERIANEGMSVIAPYVREIVHTTSMRLNPQDPLILPAYPGNTVTNAATGVKA